MDDSLNNMDDTQAPLMEHLEELRNRLMWSVAGIVISFAILIFFVRDIYDLLVWPYQWVAGEPVKIQIIDPFEHPLTYINLALFGSIFLAFPILATQVYMFVAPGLYKNERHAFLPFLIATPILFILGALLVYFAVIPMTVQFLLALQGDRFVVQYTASKYLGFVITLILAFGFCFQLPVLFTLLAKVGLVTADWLRSKRKFAVVGVFLVAAFLTPPDPVSQIALAIPTLLLYEVSIFCAARIEKKRQEQEEEDDDD